MKFYVTVHIVSYSGKEFLLLSATGVDESTVKCIIDHYGSSVNRIRVSKIVENTPIIDEQTERECEA